MIPAVFYSKMEWYLQTVVLQLSHILSLGAIQSNRHRENPGAIDQMAPGFQEKRGKKMNKISISPIVYQSSVKKNTQSLLNKYEADKNRMHRFVQFDDAL